MLAVTKYKASTLASSPLRFNSALHMIPHPEKKAKGGEDAAHAGSRLLAVADGVGGWVDQGVDPAKFSRGLIRAVKDLFPMNEAKYADNPKELLIDAAGKVKEMGSSTLVLAAIGGDGRLNTANIGDSGYMLLRPAGEGKFEMVFKSVEQQHSFNFPFQIGTNGDDPSKADSDFHAVFKKDILILGTDGLFDNLDEIQVQRLVEQYSAQNELSPSGIAKHIAEAAFKASLDTENISPFGEHARKAGIYYKGGKSDDITVVVGIIT